MTKSYSWDKVSLFYDDLRGTMFGLSFDGFGSFSWHNIFFRLLQFSQICFSDFQRFGLKRLLKVVEMRIWCIKIGIVLALLTSALAKHKVF
jgi:hypothetical protein